MYEGFEQPVPRRVVVTGLGAITPIGAWQGEPVGRRAGGPQCGAAPSSISTPPPSARHIAASHSRLRRGRPPRRTTMPAVRPLLPAHGGRRAAGLDRLGAGRHSPRAKPHRRLRRLGLGRDRHGRVRVSHFRRKRPAPGKPLAGPLRLRRRGLVQCGHCLGLNGPATANGNSCASGAVAIGDAFRMIQRGDRSRRLVAVGGEAPLAPLCYGSFALIRAMSARNDDPEARLPSLRPRPGRVRHGRGRGRPGAGVLEHAQGPRRDHLRGSPRATPSPMTLTT